MKGIIDDSFLCTEFKSNIFCKINLLQIKTTQVMKSKFVFLTSVLMMFAMFRNSYSQQDVNGWFWLNGQPQGHSVNWSKVIDAANIVAVTGRGLFMKSTDGGDSWRITQAGPYDSTGGLNRRDLLTGWFFDANTGIVAGQSQLPATGQRTVVSKTTDGGLTWTTKYVNLAAGSSVNDFHFINSNTGYLCGGTNARLYKTIDKGETWTAITSVPALTYYSIYAFSENKIILGSDSRTYVMTTDGGASWSTLTIPSAPVNAQMLDVYFKDANTGYIIGNPNYFGFTTDGGNNWTARTHSSTRGQRALVYNSGDVWTAGDYEYVYKTTNDGASWDSVKFYDMSNINQPPPFIIYGMGGSGNDFVVVGQFGQVTTSNDGGVTWRNKNYAADPGNQLYASVYAQSANGKVWVGSNQIGVSTFLYSTNGGTNWTAINSGTSTPIRDFDFPSANIGYSCGGRFQDGFGAITKSTDGGATWTSLSLPSPFSSYQLNTIDFVNDNTGWTGGIQSNFTPHLIGKTTDGGATWVQQTLAGNPNGGVGSVDMVNENIGYATSAAGLHYTTDGGATWPRITSSFLTGVSINGMQVINKDVVFLSSQGSGGVKKVMRTTDGGNNWTDLTSNMITTSAPFRTRWLNLNHGVVCGASGYMAKTTNGGLSWTESNPGFSTTVDVSFPNKNAWFTVSDRNGQYQVGRKLENLTSISVNVNVGIEGFWNGTSQVSDTVRVELRNSTSPYALVDQGRTVLTPGVGYGSIEFNTAGAGSYYIVVKHRNTIQTWSATPVAMTNGGNYNYNFTSALTQAYGSNMVLKLGRYCFFSGDVNQDEVVDGSDLSAIDNDAFNFVSGYVATDCNGDNSTDGSDASIADNNAFNTVTVVRP
jgi:photosystem II stability/assembly factor-like uncharacterized protein